MIHQYKLNGYCIVLDIYSGSVHVVDPVAYDVIALYETTAPEEISRQMELAEEAAVRKTEAKETKEKEAENAGASGSET